MRFETLQADGGFGRRSSESHDGAVAIDRVERFDPVLG
jgi:hypothetical protein